MGSFDQPNLIPSDVRLVSIHLGLFCDGITDLSFLGNEIVPELSLSIDALHRLRVHWHQFALV